MASTPTMAANANVTDSGGSNEGYRFALVSLTTLFFMWGFITSLNDILIPHLRNVFDLNYTQAMLVQFCFFGAYFIVSVPAGIITAKLGFQKGIVVGLIGAGIGCVLFYPAAAMQSYPVFLGALFVLASGITLLQVSANPYVTLLGDAKTASSRLTMTQAFNSLGTTVAPFFGAYLILSEATDAVANAEAVQFPYLLLAGALFFLAAIFAYLKLPNLDAGHKEEEVVEGSAWNYRHLVLGAVGIFAYVGAEVSIGSFLVNFLGEDYIAGMEEIQAAKYIAYYWGGAMVGRFIGAAVMQKVPGGIVLAFNAVAVGVLLVVTMATTGAVAMWAVLAIGLFNSIMFPTIFSLAVTGLGKHTAQGSGVLCLAIVGGALVPLLQGVFADQIGIHLSFVVPLVCYFFIVYYGLVGSKPVESQQE
jgi:FHS family L-fucose permease-like MFS transporter